MLIECPIPKKLECFQQIPILDVACGENHSIAVRNPNIIYKHNKNF